MRKHLMLTRATNWQFSFLCQLRRFQNRNFWYALHDMRYLHENETLHIPTFIWKLITSTLSFMWHETNSNGYRPWGPVFRTGPFLRRSTFSQVQGLGPGPVFRRCLIRKTPSAWACSSNSIYPWLLNVNYIFEYWIYHFPFNLYQLVFI